MSTLTPLMDMLRSIILNQTCRKSYSDLLEYVWSLRNNCGTIYKIAIPGAGPGYHVYLLAKNGISNDYHFNLPFFFDYQLGSSFNTKFNLCSHLSTSFLPKDDSHWRRSSLLLLFGRSWRCGAAAHAWLLLPGRYGGFCPSILYHSESTTNEGLCSAMAGLYQMQAVLPRKSFDRSIVCFYLVHGSELWLPR